MPFLIARRGRFFRKYEKVELALQGEWVLSQWTNFLIIKMIFLFTSFNNKV